MGNIERYIQERRDAIEYHTRKEAEHRDKIVEAQADVEEAEKFMARFAEWANNLPKDRPNRPRRHDHITADDIAHCRTQRAAMREIATLSGGGANPTEAAAIIMEAGLTKSEKPGSLVSTLQKLLSDELEWEWIDYGVYKLREFEAPELEEIEDSEELAASSLSADAASLSPADFSERSDELGWIRE